MESYSGDPSSGAIIRIMAMVVGYYTLTLTKSEDRQRLNESQKNVLNRDYPTLEEASRARSVLQREWDIELKIKHPVKPGN
jgi:hypothetical protein